MALDNRFIGREGKRLPVMMEVKLVPAEGASDRRGKAMIDNISEHGARVFASTPWWGEQVEVTPAAGEAPLKAEVVYCLKHGNDKFCGRTQVSPKQPCAVVHHRKSEETGPLGFFFPAWNNEGFGDFTGAANKKPQRALIEAEIEGVWVGT